jgi:PAS domain S-box-containing protein
LLDLDCTLLEANRTALDFAGVRLEEVRGRPLWETHWWAGSSERESRLEGACADARQGRTVQYQEDVSGAAGRIATVEFSVKPVLDADGKVIQLLADGRDITEHKRVEDALRAVDALSTLGRLAARVAHEINNPLAGIKSSFLLVKDAVPPTHRYHRYVGAIEREIDRIAMVTRELYGMYRAELAEKNESAVAVVISDAVALLNQLNRATSVRIHTDTSRAPAILPHPDALVRQVVFNLIQNAVEASPPNGSVGVTAWTENGTFCLSVQDDGPGVPPVMRERIFDDFVSTKTGLTTGGMGLGLSIVRRSLRALRGEIEIHDAPGGGADFRVRLPLA